MKSKNMNQKQQINIWEYNKIIIYGIWHKHKKEWFKTEYVRRRITFFKTVQLNNKNASKSITGSNSTDTRIFWNYWLAARGNTKTGRKTRQMLTFDGLHHQRADTGRLRVHRKKGGGGLMQKDRGYVTEINKFMEYMEGRKDLLMQTIKTHQ